MQRVPFSERASLGSTARLFGKDFEFGKRSERKRLLTVDATKIWDDNQPPGPLAWALLISTEIIVPAPTVGGIIPVKARIGLGAGGITQWFELDAFPSMTVRAPTPSITVEVFWDDVLQNEVGTPFSIPGEVRILATAHRSDGATSAAISRQENTRVATGGFMLRSAELPPFTDRFALRAGAANEIYKASTTILAVTGPGFPGGFPVLEMTGAQMLDVVQAGKMVTLPSTANFIHVLGLTESVEPWNFELGLAL